MTDALEQGLIRSAHEARSQDANAEIERAFVVRSTTRDLARIAGGGYLRSRTVYVLELWGDMTVCHSAPAGVDPCERSDGITVVYDSTLLLRGMYFERLGAEQLGEPFDLTSRLD